MPPLPFTGFLLYLQQQGIPLGLPAYAAVRKLIAGWTDSRPAALRDAMASLLARSEPELQQIKDLFEQYYSLGAPTGSHPPAPDPPSPPPAADTAATVPPKQASRVKVVVGVGLLALLIVAIGLLLRHGTRTPPAPSDHGSVDAGLSATRAPDASTAMLSDLGPPQPVIVEPIPADMATPAPVTPARPRPPPEPTPRAYSARRAAACGGTVLVVAFLTLYWMRARRHRQNAREIGRRAALAAMPGPWLYKWRLPQLRSPLRRDDIDEFATLLHRLCAQTGAGRQLDIERTIDKLARTGVVAALPLRPQPLRQAIILLIDCGHDTQVFAARFAALVDGLLHRGIPVVRWYFDKDAEWVAACPYGPPVPLLVALGPERDVPGLILSCGSDLDDPGLPLPGWIEALRTFPRWAFLHPLADPDAWPRRLQGEFPIPVWPLTRLGLRGAAFAIAHDRALRAGARVHRDRIRVDTPVDRGAVRGLLRLLALAPRPTLEVVELLRQTFYPRVPDQALAHIVQATSGPGGDRLHISVEAAARLLTELRRVDAAQEQAARRVLLDALRDSAPPADSVAHLRWRLDRALQLLHMKPDGTAVTDSLAEHGAAELAALAATPLFEDVADSLHALRLPGEPPDPRALTVETPLGADTVRRLARLRSPAGGDVAFGAIDWPRPGMREVLASLLVALLTLVGMWALGALQVKPESPAPLPTVSERVDMLPPDLRPESLPASDLAVVEPPIRDMAVAVDQGGRAAQPPRAAPPTLTIVSFPPGAAVFIDGLFQGRAAPKWKRSLPRGLHEIRLELEGHKPVATSVNLAAPTTLNIPMDKAPARLDVRCLDGNKGACGADVIFDGFTAGSAPTLLDVPAGRHLVELKKLNYKPSSEIVELKNGETRVLMVDLAVMNARLLISADVEAADVLLDGAPKGQTPLLVAEVSAGEHLVEVQSKESGTVPWRQVVKVSVNQLTKVVAKLRPAGAPSRATTQTPAILPPLSTDNQDVLVGSRAAHTTIRADKLVLSERVFFDFDKDTIKPVSFRVLDEVAAVLKARPDIKRMRIEGHTDNKGSDLYCLDLSARRAHSVLIYLIERGVETWRLSTAAFGFRCPLVPNDTPDNRAQNRRIDFVILEQEGVAPPPPHCNIALVPRPGSAPTSPDGGTAPAPSSP